MDDAKHFTLFPFETAFKIVTRRADTLLHKALGCTRREMWVLICAESTEMSQREIGEALGLHPNVVVKLLDNLERKRFLRRVRREDDRREQIVQLTLEGKSTVEKYSGDTLVPLRKVFYPLTDEQITQWMEFSLQIAKDKDLYRELAPET